MQGCRCRGRRCGAVLAGARAWRASTARSSPTLRIPSIVVTLATMVALRDGLRWVTQGAWVQDLPPTFQWLGLPQTLVSVRRWPPLSPLLVTARSWRCGISPGPRVYATGSNREAARLAGLDTSLVVHRVRHRRRPDRRWRRC